MLSGLPFFCCVSGQVLAKHIEGEEKAWGLILSHASTHFRDVLKEAKSDGLVLMKCTSQQTPRMIQPVLNMHW
jgi:hypothetical protein